MINGEEETPRVSSIDFSDQLLQKENGRDASPCSSLHYSSCGESEFERYCSANSALGTPSMCSSTGPFHDSLESEFGSFKGGLLSGDATEFENFSLGPSLIKLSSLDKIRLGNQGFYNGRTSSTRGLKAEDVNTEMIQERGSNEDMCGEATIKEEDRAILCRSDLQFQTSVIDSEDRSSIGDEHSDGDESLSDTDGHSRKYVPRNLSYIKEPKAENDNPFLINSSTAFGTNDWDEFELEATELVDTLFDLSGFEERDKGCTESDKIYTKSFCIALQNQPDDIALAGKGEENTNITLRTKHAPDVGDFCENSENILRSRDLTVLTQRQQGDVARESITVRDSGDLSAEVKTLVVSQSLVTNESLCDSVLNNNQTEDRPVVMTYLQSCSSDDVLDVTSIELGDKVFRGRRREKALFNLRIPLQSTREEKP